MPTVHSSPIPVVLINDQGPDPTTMRTAGLDECEGRCNFISDGLWGRYRFHKDESDIGQTMTQTWTDGEHDANGAGLEIAFEYVPKPTPYTTYGTAEGDWIEFTVLQNVLTTAFTTTNSEGSSILDSVIMLDRYIVGTLMD